MNIAIDGQSVEFISLSYRGKDPLNTSKSVFNYTSINAINDYYIFYLQYQGIIKAVSKSNIDILSNSRLKLNVAEIFGIDGLSGNGFTKLLADKNTTNNFDYIDKFGQSGTLYAYNSFVVSNNSTYTRLVNTYITSEDIMFNFHNSNPLQVKEISYLNGNPSKSISIDPSYINSSSLIAFFSNVYVGSIQTNGVISGYTSPKTGTLEVLSQGRLEFSTSMSGPWSKVLMIPELSYKQSYTVYARTGEIINTPIRRLNSVRVFTTEDI